MWLYLLSLSHKISSICDDKLSHFLNSSKQQLFTYLHNHWDTPLHHYFHVSKQCPMHISPFLQFVREWTDHICDLTTIEHISETRFLRPQRGQSVQNKPKKVIKVGQHFHYQFITLRNNQLVLFGFHCSQNYLLIILCKIWPIG